MKWTDIDKDKLGEPLYVTPNYSYPVRSLIDYHSGIPAIDNALAEKKVKFSAMRVELCILIYQDILMFLLVRDGKAKGHSSISRDNVLRVNAIHGQMLDIRKDPPIHSSEMLAKWFGMLFGLLGIIPAMILGLFSSIKKKNKPVLGSMFEIILDSKKDNEYEKIIICCTDKNKEIIENICNKIVRQ